MTTKPPLHKCPVPSCEEMIAKNQVICRAHNRLVSEEAKQSVWATWKAYREAKLDETLVEAMRLYRFACEAVLNEVKDALKKGKAA